jgi:hypothetical protein
VNEDVIINSIISLWEKGDYKLYSLEHSSTLLFLKLPCIITAHDHTEYEFWRLLPSHDIVFCDMFSYGKFYLALITHAYVRHIFYDNMLVFERHDSYYYHLKQ